MPLHEGLRVRLLMVVFGSVVGAVVWDRLWCAARLLTYRLAGVC